MPRRFAKHLFAACLVAILAYGLPAHADDDGHSGERDRESEREHGSHERVREAVERGDIKPLSDVLTIVGPRLPGEVVGVEVEHEKGEWIYEFRVLNRDGRIFEVYVDGATAEIRKIEDK